jgi:hypothetical protein
LLEGLSANFGWMKLHFRLPSHQGYAFEEVSKIAVDYASDKQFLRKFAVTSSASATSKKKATGSLLSVSEQKKQYCFAFNSAKGCIVLGTSVSTPTSRCLRKVE